MLPGSRLLDLILLESVTCKSLQASRNARLCAVVSWRKCSGLLKSTATWISRDCMDCIRAAGSSSPEPIVVAEFIPKKGQPSYYVMSSKNMGAALVCNAHRVQR